MSGPNESHLEFYKRWSRLSKPYFKWQLEQFSQYIGRRIGDVGCGLGNFADFLGDKELYLGFEPDKELAGEFRSIHKSSNLKLAENGNILTDAALTELKANKLDTLICVNVLEHINEDRIALKNMADGIVDGGHICIIVPALPFLYGTLDKLDNHYRRYTKKSLTGLADGLSLEVVTYRYINLIGAIGWFIRGKILKEKKQQSQNYTIINKLLPAISFLENMIKPPFGLSLVLVLRKTKR